MVRNMETTTKETTITTMDTKATNIQTMEWNIQMKEAPSTTTIIIITMTTIKMPMIIITKTKITQKPICLVIKTRLTNIEIQFFKAEKLFSYLILLIYSFNILRNISSFWYGPITARFSPLLRNISFATSWTSAALTFLIVSIIFSGGKNFLVRISWPP